MVLIPWRLSSFLRSHHDRLGSGDILADAQCVRNEHLLISSPKGNRSVKSQLIYPHALEDLLEHCGLSHLALCKANHAPSAFCISLTAREGGFKVVYTGDTRPCRVVIHTCIYGLDK